MGGAGVGRDVHVRVHGNTTMKPYIRTLGVIFSIALNVAFVGAYAYRTVTARPTFAYEEIQLSSAQHARMVSGRDRFMP